MDASRLFRQFDILTFVAIVLMIALRSWPWAEGDVADSEAALTVVVPFVATARQEVIMSTQPRPDLEVDSQLLEQLEDEEQHLLAGFRRLSPSERANLLELVDSVVEGAQPAARKHSPR